jgi:hypothetical protein
MEPRRQVGKNPSPKISAYEPIKFRPGPLGEKIEALLAELRKREPAIELSSVLRDGLEMFWPQIRAGLLLRQRSGLEDKKVVSLTLICAKAIENGLSIEQIEEVLNERMEGAYSGK